MNIYDDPKDFGVEILGEIDLGCGYSYDKFVVWRNNSEVGWATDSGCSCSSPFWDMGITNITWGNQHNAAAALKAWYDENHSSDDFDQEYAALMEKITG